MHSFIQTQRQIVELQAVYDGNGADGDLAGCRITEANQGASCQITMVAESHLTAPVYVYYQLSNFYQNHRQYVKSLDQSQLMGCTGKGSGVCSSYNLEKLCSPLVKNGSLTLSPCGLIANSVFNDQVLVTSGQATRYDGIAWGTDSHKFAQPDGFVTAASESAYDGCLAGKSQGTYHTCDDAVCDAVFGGDGSHQGCKAYQCPSDAATANYYGCEAGATYGFWYPDDAATQYFYESFPEVTTPMTGIMNERFFVWMRTAALPRFRKLYAVITDDVAAGESVTFSVRANFDVSKFDGSKSLVMTTTTWFGGKNPFLGLCFLVVGSLCLAFGSAFAIKQVASPRSIGDLDYLI